MKLPIARLFVLLSGLLVSTGCVTRWRTNNLLVSEVAQAPNRGDRYVIVHMRDADASVCPEAQELASKAMRKLSVEAPEWFADDPESIPVVAAYRMLPERETYGGPTMALSGNLWALTLGSFPLFWEHRFRTIETFLFVKETPVGVNTFEWESKILSGNFVSMGVMCPKSGGWEDIPLGSSRTLSPPSKYGGSLDLICASLVRSIQRLTPTEREWLRNNEEAWYFDAKLGNKRNRPVSIVRNPEKPTEVPSGGLVREAPKNRPRIVSQSWEYETRRGELSFDLSGCEDRDAALAWVRDEYLPDYCRTLGVAVSADDPASASPPTIRIDGFTSLPGGTVRVEFFLVD